MLDEIWTKVHDTVQETGFKNTPKNKKCITPKWMSVEALQIAVKRRDVKGNEKRKEIPI